MYEFYAEKMKTTDLLFRILFVLEKILVYQIVALMLGRKTIIFNVYNFSTLTKL